VYISTRELLGQTNDRSSDKAIIESRRGTIKDVKELFNEPTLGPILSQLGADALSNEALRRLAAALEKQQTQPKISAPAQVDSPAS